MELLSSKQKQRKLYYEKNKEKCIQATRDRYKKTREARIEEKRRYREKYPDRIMWTNAKLRAKENNIEFNIEFSDIVIPKFCPLLGIPISTGPLHEGSPSLDRVDISKGYIKGNVRVISYKANTMKSNATKEELKLFAQNILQYLENK